MNFSLAESTLPVNLANMLILTGLTRILAYATTVQTSRPYGPYVSISISRTSFCHTFLLAMATGAPEGTLRVISTMILSLRPMVTMSIY